MLVDHSVTAHDVFIQKLALLPCGLQQVQWEIYGFHLDLNSPIGPRLELIRFERMVTKPLTYSW